MRTQALGKAIICITVALLFSPGIKTASAADASSILDDPAVITDNSRNPPDQVDDFLRLIFVPSTVPITTPGLPSQKRSFFGDTRFYMPPITPAEIVAYAGGTVSDTTDLVAMRCRPTNQSMVDPQLAIWPTLANLLQQDLPAVSCPAAPGASTQAQAFCLAQQFQDTPSDPLIESLYNAVAFGRALFELPADSTGLTGAKLISNLYGIGPGHSGLGFVVKDSASGTATAAQALEQSVVPEYLLRNVTLAQANCRCVRVPFYAGRDDQPLSPLFVWALGILKHDGSCRTISRILPDIN